jgi:hypothetical protein
MRPAHFDRALACCLIGHRWVPCIYWDHPFPVVWVCEWCHTAWPAELT